MVKTRLPGELASGGGERFRVHDGGVAWTRAGELVEMDLMLRASEVDKATSVELVQINATSTGGACGWCSGRLRTGQMVTAVMASRTATSTTDRSSMKIWDRDFATCMSRSELSKQACS